MEKFSTSLTGYRKEEVNKFVDDVVKQVEAIIDALKAKDNEITGLKKDLEHYKGMESTFSRAILVAEDASNQIKRMARDEGGVIVEDAKKNASRIINEALIRAEKTQMETESLKRNIITFKRRIRALIESQLEMVDEMDYMDL